MSIRSNTRRALQFRKKMSKRVEVLQTVLQRMVRWRSIFSQEKRSLGWWVTEVGMTGALRYVKGHNVRRVWLILGRLQKRNQAKSADSRRKQFGYNIRKKNIIFFLRFMISSRKCETRAQERSLKTEWRERSTRKCEIGWLSGVLCSISPELSPIHLLVSLHLRSSSLPSDPSLLNASLALDLAGQQTEGGTLYPEL